MQSTLFIQQIFIAGTFHSLRASFKPVNTPDSEEIHQGFLSLEKKKEKLLAESLSTFVNINVIEKLLVLKVGKRCK